VHFYSDEQLRAFANLLGRYDRTGEQQPKPRGNAARERQQTKMRCDRETKIAIKSRENSKKRRERMLDIKFIRENPEAVKENIRKKFQDAKLPLVDEVIEADAQYRARCGRPRRCARSATPFPRASAC
jgi:hypothetical protein